MDGGASEKPAFPIDGWSVEKPFDSSEHLLRAAAHPPACPFCARVQSKAVDASNDLAVSFEDAFPLTQGHRLIVPRRHTPGFFDLTHDELAAIGKLVSAVAAEIRERYRPQGFNVGVNEGAAAGQTVDHAHVHVIPRYEGDVEDPRGGIRWVVPSKAAYWRED